ncbi:MAG: beta-ketoacyl-[acyl-carrier-protein] synthase family protein, partial [bacterium]
IGIGKEELWASVVAGRSNVVRHDQYIHGELWDSFYVSKISNFDIKNIGLAPRFLEYMENNRLDEDPDLLYLMAAVKLALEDSRLGYDEADNNIGLILTHENPGVDRYVKKVFEVVMDCIDGRMTGTRSKKEVAARLYEQHRQAVYNMQSFMYLHHVSKVFSLHGCSLFINNACASGLFAIETASQQIKSGKNGVVIVAGADHPLFITKYLWFKALGLYANHGIMRPFDRDRDGFVFGDGGSALVLEDADHAAERGATIYGEYLGGGFNQEAWKVSVPNVSEDFYTKAFRQALETSRIKPEQIDLVNPHGAATKIADRYEAKTITDIFGHHPERVLISAFKPYVGHNLGGSALLELAILLLALQNDLVPPTLNYETPDPALRIELNRDFVRRGLQVVAKMANGFAGYNAVGIFGKL